MNEFTKKIIIGIVIFVVFVVAGQRNIGPSGLFTQMAGLAGLIILLWLYNRQYK